MKVSTILILAGVGTAAIVGGVAASRFLNPGGQKIPENSSQPITTPDGKETTVGKRVRELETFIQTNSATLNKAKAALATLSDGIAGACSKAVWENHKGMCIFGCISAKEKSAAECNAYREGKKSLSALTYSNDVKNTKNGKRVIEFVTKAPQLKKTILDLEAKVNTATKELNGLNSKYGVVV